MKCFEKVTALKKVNQLHTHFHRAVGVRTFPKSHHVGPGRVGLILQRVSGNALRLMALD